MKKIGIFCSASDTIDRVYFDRAKELGHWMGRNGKTLVYGGADLGLMDCIAQAVKETGGHIVGVVPTKLEERGRVSTLPDRIVHTRNLSDRKDILTEESDILVALPGGIGTLDEVFHVMAASSIGYHSKQVIFYNIDGFYDELIDILQKLDGKHFARHPLSHYFQVANSLDELVPLLNASSDSEENPNLCKDEK